MGIFTQYHAFCWAHFKFAVFDGPFCDCEPPDPRSQVGKYPHDTWMAGLAIEDTKK